MKPLFYSISVVGMNPDAFTIEHLNGCYVSPEAAQDAALKLLPAEYEPTSIKINAFDAATLRMIADKMEAA